MNSMTIDRIELLHRELVLGKKLKRRFLRMRVGDSAIPSQPLPHGKHILFVLDGIFFEKAYC